MMGSRFFFLQITLLLIVYSHHVNADEDDGDDNDDESCVRLTSAFNYDGDVYLVSGNDYFLLDSDFQESDQGTLEEDFDAPEGTIDAALMYDGDLFFFKGSHYYSYNYLYYFGTFKAATSSSKWGHFFKHGLDAAATLGDTSFFFHGCKYAKGNGGNYEYGTMDELGLPCDVDAAWSQGAYIFITLENDVWVMDENEQVIGPERLSKLVTLTTRSICPNDPFFGKIRAEQSYEREHKCTIIDAAITWRDNVYIFNDNEYITLDDNGNEIEKAGIYEWGDLPGNIDAGVVFSGDNHAYFFKGDGYYKYFYGFLHNYASGPRSDSFWGPFFEQGIDAAGNHNGQSYFFKRCEMHQYEANMTISSHDVKLPCDVDAAFSREGTLYVIKRNQVWTWRTDEEVADEPTSLITAVNMTSWTACAPDEE